MMFWNKLIFNKRQLIFVLVSTALVVAFVEISLTLLASAHSRIDWLLSSPWIYTAVQPTVLDKHLGHRPNPEYPGHDRNGFRNEAIPSNVSVIALGDSQTYGIGVKSEDAWPKQLESLIGTSVYSMAYGGYGPVHSLILLEEAINLNSQIIIEGFYSGNDLYDSFNLVYNNGQFPELKSLVSQLQASVQEKEAAAPIAEHVGRMFRMGKIQADVPEDDKGLSVRRYLAGHSKTYGLLRRAWYEFRSAKTEIAWSDVKANAERNSAYTLIFDDGQFRTVFTPQYRLSALNLKDPRIQEGQRISLEAIKLMSEGADANHIHFLVVLIPTKELVFSEVAPQSDSSYRVLIANESQFWTTTKDFLTKHGIEYLDSLPALRHQLSIGVQPYQISPDGHPNERGNSAIAELIKAYIEPILKTE